MVSSRAQVKFYTLVSEGPFIPGQTFQVQYVAEGAKDIQQFTVPSFSDFLVLESFDSKSTSVQSPGLKMTEVYSKIVVLSALKKGKYTIPAATAIIDGTKRKSNPVKIEVVARRTTPIITNESPEEVAVEETSQLRDGENIADKVKKNLFLRAQVNKNNCYAGETVLLTYKMYSRIDASSQVIKRPSLTGLSILEMVDTYDGKPEIEKIDGIPYYVNLIRKVQGFPLQAGTILLDKAEVSSTVHFVKITEPVIRNLPGDRIGYSAYDYPVTLTTPPTTIYVKPLPLTNQPENFSGAVGNFSMHIEVMQKEIHPGDLVKIRLVLKGTGNIPLLVPPPIQWPKGVDTAEPEVKEDFNKYVFPLEGSKSFEYSFTAPDTGTYIIPAISFSYFNPVSQSYKSSRSDTIKIHVTDGSSKQKTLIQQSLPSLKEETVPKELYWFGIIAFLITGWIAFQFWRPREKKSADSKPAEIIISENEKENTDPLLAAKYALENNNTVLFYQELEQAIWKLTAQYCSILPSSLNKQNISTVLAIKGVQPETIAQLIGILNECEWFRYALSPVEGGEINLLQKAEAMLGLLQKKN